MQLAATYFCRCMKPSTAKNASIALAGIWPLSAALALSIILAPSSAWAQDSVRFITVDQGPGEFEGDQQLHRKLGKLVNDGMPRKQSYETVVAGAIRDDDEPRIFRMTPYVYVAAEMQGAKLDVIGTYLSKSTENTTYNSYFVVRRDAFPNTPEGSTPSLARVVSWLRTSSLEHNPLRFLYHSRWSTSSYFLPSLYFRLQRIFAVSDREAGQLNNTRTDEPVSEILVEHIDSNSSSELVRQVAKNQGRFAAVWDGTRSKFDGTFEGAQVYFVKIPGDIPNDLLVSSRSVNKDTKAAIGKTLLTGISLSTPESDVHTWLQWSANESRNARAALSVLRHKAAAPPSPVVVEIIGEGEPSVLMDELLDSVRQAVRLSSTELVVKDDYYVMSDIEWVLELIHDDALRLTAKYRDFALESHVVEQEFRISYLDPQDLTHRIGNLIHNRIHRIRPVWLYQNATPTVIRDFNFAVQSGTAIPYQVIDWEDPGSNNYKLIRQQTTETTGIDFNKLQLSDSKFPKTLDESLAFEPMGRREYRVLLIRPSNERDLFRYLTVALVALFILAAAGAIWDLKRSAGNKLKRGKG